MGQAADFEEEGGPSQGNAARLADLERELLHAGRRIHQDRLVVERAEREELLATVSHELRTPVTVIGGYARMLLSGEVGRLNDEQRRFLEESRKSCHKLDAFIEKVLSASRQPKAGQVLELCTASLRPVIDDVTASLRSVLDQRGVRITVHAEAERCVARFDRGGIERVLLNLVGNAARFAGEQIEITTREAGGAPRPLLEVSVSDDGPGVAPEDRERIFEPYVQAQGDAGRDGGLGLGLAICRRLVEAHGGKIGVAGRAGGGSRFFFTLPRVAV
jgi:signal transduction histidine kinase